MLHMYERALFDEIATTLRNYGLFVYRSKSGSYGFYTDGTGDRVVSFQTTGGRTMFSGNYATCKDGTGWQMTEDVPRNRDEALALLYALAPAWANRAPVYMTCEDYLACYGRSSGFKIVT